MIQFILALWLALTPAHQNTTYDNGTHITNTGGETEPIPPPPPPHHP